MARGIAREHVQVARVLRVTPLSVAEFRAGRLSYSNIREMTRVARRVDEQVMVELAKVMTASQLSRAISGFGAAGGSRRGQDAVRQAQWFVREDGMVEIRAVLPAEVGAELLTALEHAMDRDGSAPPTGRREPRGGDTAGRALKTRGTAEPEGDADERAVSADELDAEVTTTANLGQRRADAHHPVAWSEGDLRDIDGLSLLCRRHHVMVPEGGMRVVRDAARSTPRQPRLLVLDISSQPIQPRWQAMLEHIRGPRTAPRRAGPGGGHRRRLGG